MHWRTKGMIQKALVYVPAGQHLHFLLQRTAGGLKNVAGELDVKVDDWRIMVGHLRNAGVDLQGCRMMEIGSGWYPTLPFCLYLGGVGRVHTVDLNRHMKAGLTREAADLLGKYLELIAQACGASHDDVLRRHRLLADRLTGIDVESATDGVIQYRAPGDARRTNLPDHSVDVVFSNSVLEHVPGDAIEGMFREAMRILVPGGVMFHSVNCGDHYAYVDRTISQLNYLQYSDNEWEKWNNDFLYQNRLRAHAFVEMAERAGFALELNTAKPSERRLRELEKVRVHSQFAHLPPEKLCITSIDFIARKKA